MSSYASTLNCFNGNLGSKRGTFRTKYSTRLLDRIPETDTDFDTLPLDMLPPLPIASNDFTYTDDLFDGGMEYTYIEDTTYNDETDSTLWGSAVDTVLTDDTMDATPATWQPTTLPFSPRQLHTAGVRPMAHHMRSLPVRMDDTDMDSITW